jgi:hypothetical protein
MRSLASTFRHLDAKHVRFATVPITTESGVRDGQSVVLLDMPALDRMFTAIAKGKAPAKARSAASAGSSRSPSPSATAKNGVPCIP